MKKMEERDKGEVVRKNDTGNIQRKIERNGRRNKGTDGRIILKWILKRYD
jgi:hypothetical protein